MHQLITHGASRHQAIIDNMYSWLLLYSCMALLALSLYINRENIVSPANLLCFSFTISVLCGILNYEEWDFSISINTFLVIVCGISVFLIMCIIANFLYDLLPQYKHSSDSTILKLPLYVYICGAILPLITMLIVSKEIISIVSTFRGSTDSLSSAIGQYDQLLKFSAQDIRLSSLANNLNSLSQALLFFWLIRSLKYYFSNKSIDIGSLIALIISVPLPLLSGARNGLYLEICAIIVIWLMYYLYYAHKALIISFKSILLPVIFIISILISFKPLLSILGREDDNSTFDYISLYLGAPIKNFDTYIRGYSGAEATRWGEMTFANTRNDFSFIFGANTPDWNTWQPFRTVNGKDLGNVYTLLYPLSYDFGVIGTILVMAILGFISQILFKYARNTLLTHQSGFPISVCIYGTVSYGLVFAFFSNRLISTITSMQFAKFIVFWICIQLLYKLHQITIKDSRVMAHFY